MFYVLNLLIFLGFCFRHKLCKNNYFFVPQGKGRSYFATPSHFLFLIFNSELVNPGDSGQNSH